MKNNIRKILIVVDIGLIFVLVCLLIFFYQLETPLNRDTGEKIFVVEEGQGLEEIAENLKTQEIIRNKLTLVLYIWFKGKTKNLQAGKYSLSPAMNILEITTKIIKGEVIKNWVKVTIPEGWTNQQIEDRLISLGMLSKNGVLPLEFQGYLFPDTYYFEKDSSVETIIKKMRDNFDEKIKSLVIERPKIYDILKMASILEKEIISDEDRAIVSGIFWKRIKNKYPLESCATVAYVLGVDKWRYSYEDTRIKSPYNTYINIGLPPTPINNPGLSAIRAAIYPKESDYNFFLTDPETGKTIFSKTFQEHNANKRKYFK
jgi:UPF0755 protein